MARRYGGALMEEVAGIGPSTIGKIPGQTCTASITVKHLGPVGTFYISWGVMPGSNIPGVYLKSSVTWMVQSQPFNVTDDVVEKTYTITLSAPFPNVNATENFYDCLVQIADQGNNLVAGNASSVSFDDIYYRSDLVGAEFNDLTAQFT